MTALSDFRHDFDRPVWVLLYLHDWDDPRPDGSQPIYPEIHGVYADEKTALANQRAMGRDSASKYRVRKAYYITQKETIK
jgi:hypothetical protein